MTQKRTSMRRARANRPGRSGKRGHPKARRRIWMDRRDLASRQRAISRRRRQKQRERLGQALCLIFTLALLFGGLKLLGRSALPAGREAWVVQGEESEVLAPPMENGIGTLEIPGNAVLPFSQATPAPTPTATPVPEPAPTERPMATVPPAQPRDPVRIVLTAAGDCTLGGDAGLGQTSRFQRYLDQYGADYYFENVRPIFEADDFTILNLEGPLTTASAKRANRTFNFKGDPGYVSILTGSSVEVCSFANNHAFDYRQAGYDQTLEVLRQAGVGVSSYGNAHYAEKDNVTLCFLAFTEWDQNLQQILDSVKVHREASDLLVVSMHWGSEGKHAATSTQTSWGRAIVDAGADLVLGHHSHVVGGIERYKGKYIVYSLGNFCFGGNKNPSDKDTMIFQQTFVFDFEKGLEDGGVNVIPCRISSRSGSNDYQPTPLTGADARALLRKIGDYSTMEGAVWAEAFRDTYLGGETAL